MVQPGREVVRGRAENAAAALEAHAQGSHDKTAAFAATSSSQHEPYISAPRPLKLQVASNHVSRTGGSGRTRYSRSGVGSTPGNVTSRTTTHCRKLTPTNE